MLHAQIPIFTETFNELNGSISGSSDEGVAWTSSCVGCSGGGYYAVQAGAFENNNTDLPGTWVTDPIDIEDCTRITVSIDYSGEPFPGSGNLEAASECNMAGPCNGNPNDPGAGGCFNCWDFMHFEINIDGVYGEIGLIGTSNTSSAFTFDYDIEDCDGLGSSAFLEVTSQTWAAAEFMRFDNVAMVCYDEGPTGTISGTADLCPGQCADIDWDVSGGTAPYDLVFEISAGGFSLTQGLPGVPSMGSLTVCYDENGIVPSFDVATNTLTLVNGFGTNFLLELLSVTDDNGCMTELTGQEINITLGVSPTVNSIPPIEVCGVAGMNVTVDLSIYDAAIGGGDIVTYYSDVALTMEIGPMFQVSSSTTIYAVVSVNGTCDSDPVAISIIVQQAPVIDNPGMIIACGEYMLPVITGTGLTSTVSYWSGPGQTGSPLGEGTTIASDLVIYIYDEGSGCPSEVAFSIDILPQPEIDDIPSVIACGSYTLPEITGTNLSGLESYYNLPNQGGGILSPGDVITSNTVIYIYDNLNGCADESFFIVEITDGPEIMMPDTLFACFDIDLPSILGDDISSSAAYYTGPDGTGIQYDPGFEFLTDTTLYIYDGSSDCNDEKIIEIVVLSIMIDPPTDTIVCDFFLLPEITGVNLQDPYYITSEGSLYESDTIFVSQFVLAWDTISHTTVDGFTYTCGDNIGFNVLVLDQPSAGPDVPFNDCGGSVVDLLDVQGPNADAGGMFIDTSTTGALSGSNLDVSLVSGTSFSVFYEVENMCGIDTSIYTVNITDSADAGNNTSSSVCSGEDLTLVDFINQADPGGVFFNTESNMEVTDFNTDEVVMAGGSLLFYYIVGAGGTCDPDTADINFNVVTSPELDLPSDEVLCSSYELPEIMGTNLSGAESYNTMQDGSGTIFIEGDTLFNSATLYVQSGEGACAAIDSFEITVLEPESTLIEQTICNDDTLTVNGIQYWFENDFGIQEFTTAGGCDSLVEVQLVFFETDTNFINEQICWGGSFTFFGVTLDRDKPSTQVVIPLADKNSCDSVIFVNITFDDPITRNIDRSLCENDSVLINGIYYSFDNPSGIDTVFVFEECDTILNINITFDDDIMVTIDDILCEDESRMIGGELFDIMNPSGDVTVEGTAGCDSLITVDLTFIEVPMGMLTGEFCSTEVIDTLGEIFSIDNPEMEVILEGASAQNCDSSVLVSFDFILIDEGMFEEEICEGTSIEVFGVEFDESYSSGQVTVQSSQGCDSLINIIITFRPVDANFLIVDGGCDTETGYFVFQAFSEISDEYFYSLDNSATQEISIGDTIFNIAPGNHSILFNVLAGCQASIDFDISASGDLSIDLPPVVVIQEGDSYSVNLQGITNETIIWTPPTNISCTDCPNPSFDPTEDTQYFVTVIDGAGCTVSDSILIRVEQSFDVYIPNTFTPNEDGVNDRFLIFAESDIEYNLRIYDRWGNRVFEGLELITNDVNSGWDGRFAERGVSQGVYVYVVELQNEEEEVEIRKGTVTVIR